MIVWGSLPAEKMGGRFWGQAGQSQGSQNEADCSIKDEEQEARGERREEMRLSGRAAPQQPVGGLG